MKETTTDVEWNVEGKRYIVRNVPVEITHLGEEVWELEDMEILDGLRGLMTRGEIPANVDYGNYKHCNFDVPPSFPPRY